MKRGLNVFVSACCCLFFSVVVCAQDMAAPYRVSDAEVRQVLSSIESQANRFKHDLNSALDHSRLDGTKREDDINAFVKDFDRDTKHLHDQFDHHHSVSADVQAVLDKANSIDKFMGNHRLNGEVQGDWSNLRTSLDQLAGYYSVAWNWEGYATGTNTALESPSRLSDKDVARILDRIDKQAGKFRAGVDSSLDHSRLNGTKREDEINGYMKEFDHQTHRLRERYDHHQSETADVQAVLDEAAHIERFVRRYPLSEGTMREWSALKGNLDELATAYNVSWKWDFSD